MTMAIRNFARFQRLGWAVLIALAGTIGIAGVCCAQASQVAAQKSKTAAKAPVSKESAIRRVQPGDVKELPTEFVEKLNARGCTIPQFDSGDGGEGVAAETNNVIHGEFTRHGQVDWAVLCSNGRTSTVVIFWGKATACASQLARLDDAHFMQQGAGKKMHYSRAIEASDMSKVGGRGPKQMTHQGIYDEFVGKSSSLFYCNEGKWRIFPGAD